MNTLTDLQKKQLAFLEETASFYTLKNRCVTENGLFCKYFLEGKPGCAIGRHIEDKELCQKFDKQVFGDSFYVSEIHIFSRLPTHLQELGEHFLLEVQKLHDISRNWTNEGPSEEGKEAIALIKEQFNLSLPVGTPPANS